MSEWKSIQLGDHAEVLSGFPFPSEGFSQEEGVPLIRIRDLLAGELETYFIGPYPDDFVIDDGDILIGMDGDFNIVRWTKGKALLNQRVCKVFTSTAELDDGYLFWLLEPELQDIHQKTPQTTVKHLSVRDLAQLRLEVPPVDEQRLIAHILDTLDTQIQKTEALVAKLERVKEGLLHDLLTRGIDENGRLRPSPAQAPALYKESPLGLIPREWEVIPLTGLLEDGSPITYGVVKPGERDDQNGVLFIRGGDIKNGKIAFENLRTIHKAISMQYKRTLLAGGEILMSLVGYPGEVAIVPPELRGANIARQAALIRVSKTYSSEFVATFLRSVAGKQQVLGSSLGSAQQVVNLGDLRNTMIPMPPSEEQRAISLANDEQQALQDRAQLELEKLKLQKQGLMDDLLTGRVRVTPLLEQGQATTSG